VSGCSGDRLPRLQPVASGDRHPELGRRRQLGDEPDTVWTPLIATPPFPDYPAGHTAYGGAAEQGLTDILLRGSVPGTSQSSRSCLGVRPAFSSWSRSLVYEDPRKGLPVRVSRHPAGRG
jgi:hypothetical protein